MSITSDHLDGDFSFDDERWHGDDGSYHWSKPNRSRNDQRKGTPKRRLKSSKGTRKREKVESRDGTFRCRNCKTVVGPPISGGRHRNHCPLCLYSRHVDRSRPGDRASECRSMMEPVGLHVRTSGEQAVVHECLGCGTVRRNRIAADDNTIAVMRLPVVSEVRESPAEIRSVS